MKSIILLIASMLLIGAKANVIQMQALVKAEKVNSHPFVEIIRGQPVAQHSQSLYSGIKDAWLAFKKEFKKTFKTIEEESKRFKIFIKSFLHVKTHNEKFEKGIVTYQLAINEFADKTPSEMETLRGYRSSAKPLKGSTYLSSALKIDLPQNVDWRKKGAVTEVKNQGHCGSCWTFSTTGSLEGQHFRKTGKLVSLSEQQLVDCCHNEGCNGCQGGLMDYAFTYIKTNHGLDTENSYPYVSGNTGSAHDQCFTNGTIGAEDTGFVDIPSGNEEKLKEAVATIGPVSVAIDASHMSFQLYKTGVYDEEECGNERTSLDHGVLVVGYGTTDDGIDYWLVKNSWGTMWGEEGYIKMSRNKQNQCGIATQASYPLV